MTLPDTIYTYKASLMGSIYYNLNYSLGNLLGAPSTDFTYSDVIMVIAGSNADISPKDYITLQETTGDSLVGDESTYVWSVSQDEYEKGDWFLFGSTMLPWFPPPSDPAIPGNYLRRNGTSQVSSFNKGRMAVLMPTLMTVAKIVVPTVGLGVGGSQHTRDYMALPVY